MSEPVDIKADPVPLEEVEATMKQDIEVRRRNDANCALALAIEKALILLSVPLMPPLRSD